MQRPRRAFVGWLGATALAVVGTAIVTPTAALASPTTQVVVASIAVTSGPAFSATAMCPSGTQAVGGGDHFTGGWLAPPSPQPITTLSAPDIGGMPLVSVPDGAHGPADGWVAGGLSPASTTLKVGAVCASPGGTLGSTVTQVTSITLPAGLSTVLNPMCPAGYQALGGGAQADDGFVARLNSSGPDIGGVALIGVPGGTHGPADGWAAGMANTDSMPHLVKAGVICANQTGLPSTSTLVTSEALTGGGATSMTVGCASTAEATGGGVDDTGAGVVDISVGTMPDLGGAGLDVADGAHGTADGWLSAVHNTGGATQTVKYAVVCTGVPAPPPPPPVGGLKPVARIGGLNRVGTAIKVSQSGFPAAHSAPAAVLARADDFADALVGTPLAVAKGGPLLLTPGAALDPDTLAELQRVLPAGATVYVLGREGAISTSVSDQLTAAGFVVVRYGGDNRFGTAVIVAHTGLADPASVLEATGRNFPDAVTAGAAAAKVHGAVLLTEGSSQDGTTASYLSSHPGDTRYAVGGPAASADPAATSFVGIDRDDTSAKV
ncbi:MAG: cell wall-binding repeat-containing protein, partial [Acidimicrobiales bacterium]